MTTLREKKNKVLFIKPPDRFLENEFVYQQLGPHYLQRYLEQYDILSDILILYESERIRKERETGEDSQLALEHLSMLLVKADESSTDGPFDPTIFENYNIVGMSVMSPQAPDAYILNKLINTQYSHITTVIGGSHPRYYQNSVEALPEHVAFDFIVPQDGWKPMYQIASGHIKKNSKSFVLIDNFTKLANIPEPSRPIDLMKRYNFEIAGVPAYHTITALGCPFSCNFCESATEKLRKFSEDIIDKDLKVMTEVHTTLEHEKKAVMFFDDVALINPKQVERLAINLLENNISESELTQAFRELAAPVIAKMFLFTQFATPMTDAASEKFQLAVRQG